ncbi:hypothetical protein BDF20DRAFT_845020 [Mycotypha africana]|uniref:uncharacterized protein n=1 Tax=Mycotypha africana TaxID=64632 RepID=UPI002300E30B|nr:uncharacterized protein BDF20DRAFT_845020 [Mycotypha africana]KAI8991506.1 hypothetical protein BDF20DRAFT_845020 [Mycotypha africana]
MYSDRQPRRGGGRGGGGHSGRGGGYTTNNAYNNNSSSGGGLSITARLGPTNIPINDRLGQSNASNQRNSNSGGYYQNQPQGQYHHQQHNQPPPQQRGRGSYRGGGAFSSNNNNNGNRGRRNRYSGDDRFKNEFVDEDIDMRPDTSAGNVVTVTGFPPGAEQKVLGFLTRKSKAPWEALDVQEHDGFLYITVTDEATADNLCRMNNYQFGAHNLLQISRGGSNGSNAGGGMNKNNNFNKQQGDRRPSKVSALLEGFLNERWNPQAGYLDLDELPETQHSISVVISKLVQAAKSLYGDQLQTISFARNKLWSVAPLQKLADLFPNLQNLSVADNDIAEFRSLDKLRNRLHNLQELLLSGNPIQINNTLDQYRKEVLKRFPTIHTLDMQPVTDTPGSVNFTPAASPSIPNNLIVSPATNDLPLPVRAEFFDQDNSRIATQDLLSKYFPLFDTQRPSLLDLYDTDAIFSVVFSNQGTVQQQTAWGNSQMRPGQRMVIGNENIIKRINQLPATVHDLSSNMNFITDAWQTPGSSKHPVVLFLTVHGCFTEAPMGTPLSFDRSFLVAPSTPGSRAQSAGWNYVILSDSLIIRNYSTQPRTLVTA